MREILTPEQVADYLQLTTDTVYRLIRGRKLPAVRIGRAYRIPKAEVDAFLVANSTQPQLRSALFKRVLEIAKRNAERHPNLSSDDILEELEAADEERKARQVEVRQL